MDYKKFIVKLFQSIMSKKTNKNALIVKFFKIKNKTAD